MQKLTVLFVALLAMPLVLAQSQKASVQSIKGNFYVSVDDSAKIWVNGHPVYTAPINESRSPDLELKVGDRIIVNLWDSGGGSRFMLVFASSDRKSVVSFRNTNFKIVPDIGVTDFTPEQFDAWKKRPKRKRRKDILPIRSNSHWVWGELNRCTLACLVTERMLD